MLLKPVSDGVSTGTGTLTFESQILGGVLITANSINDTTVTMQRDNSSGTTVFEIVTKAPIFVAGPIDLGSQAGYFSVSGIGSGAQFYEWVE
jgi:hypothetical protein